MRWFRRREPAAADEQRTGPSAGDLDELARRFWVSWNDLLPNINAALGDREPNRVENVLCDLVAAVHPDLHFSLERGQRAIYALVVTGQEDPRLRPYTDAWRARAPEEDPIWEYHDSVPPVPDPSEVTVNLAGHRISLADVRVVAQVDEAERVVDVAVYHPELAALDEAAQNAMTYLPLDATLGERVAGERLRRVETAVHEPQNAITLLALRNLVERLGEPAPEPGETDHESG